MSPTDTSEKGLESLIFSALTGQPATTAPPTGHEVAEAHPVYGGAGYWPGDPRDYDREHAVDWVQLLAFLTVTQQRVVEQLGLAEEGIHRQQFLNRLQGEIAKRGIVDVLRHGIKHGPATIELYYALPSLDNALAVQRFNANRWTLTRQLRYSRDESQLALDLALFLNGLPLATFELKNRLTKQNVDDAVLQYQRDRNPRELLFQLGRCLAHFAVDDQEVKFCTHLTGEGAAFYPFNKGWNEGAGNPPDLFGPKTAYLWKEILIPDGLADILENFAQMDKGDKKTGTKPKLTFPRYHQLDVVHKLLDDVRVHGAGKRYLIQHSAGSGKSNSIAWLAHQLVGLERDGVPIFDSIVVVTDRKLLDKQIKDTIRQFAQVASIVGHAEHSDDLRRFLAGGKKIIITTVQKFPHVLDAIGGDHGRTFALIIDEAHSSQGGRAAASVNVTLSNRGHEDDESPEDAINRILESRHMLPNASYFAFTATPKNKTLEIFGIPYREGDKIKHRPFHTYTMKQAIEERYILDVLASFTPVDSYYRLAKTVEEDPEFDVKRAQKKLRRYVEGHERAIRQKAEIMVDHFHDHVVARRKINGQARAMVVTSGIERALQYFEAFNAYLAERKSPYRAIVAFSGETKWGGKDVTEATLNGFPSTKIPERIREDPYRFLICADKFQTGYDEPLLHTMYVDKPLSDVKAVQTLSRLNRACPGKRDTFVLDFQNDAETITKAFALYYRTTVLADETNPDKLHDLKADLDGAQVYTQDDVDLWVELYLGEAGRDRLDPILDAVSAVYSQELDEAGQVDFKGKAKAFVRTYSFLATILPFTHASWERLSTFLNFLIPKLPTPAEPDLAQGILEAIDMDSYRAEVRAAIALTLPDADGEIDPVPMTGGSQPPEPALDHLSNIVRAFNDRFGNIEWKDADQARRFLTEEVPATVAEDRAYRNARQQDDRQNARIEHDQALQKVLFTRLADHTEIFKRWSDDPGFKRELSEFVFGLTWRPPGAAEATAKSSPQQRDPGSLEDEELEGEIERTYEELRALLAQPSGIQRDRVVTQAEGRLRALQKQEARRFEERFHASLKMPIDAGETILARARALRKRLEDSATANPTAPGTDGS